MLCFLCYLFVGVDSFYEYLMKAYILFGRDELWDMFHSAYVAVQKFFRHGPWYIFLAFSLCSMYIFTPLFYFFLFFIFVPWDAVFSIKEKS